MAKKFANVYLKAGEKRERIKGNQLQNCLITQEYSGHEMSVFGDEILNILYFKKMPLYFITFLFLMIFF